VLFADVLEAAGWPGPRTPDSAEHQAVGAFNEMLSRFAALDRARPRLELRPALALLHRVAAQQVFQPAGNDAAPVQIMGVLEVPGMAFDALWVLGADDGHWPAPLQPAPFIPVALQRAHGMPEADPATALALDRDLAARLNRAAACVVWSWPRQAGEEQLRASPLLNGLIDDAEDGPANPRWPELVQRAAPALELVIDRYGDLLPEGSRMPGGTGFLRHQAACPFQGYVLHRLDAWPLEIGRFGPDPRDRGTLVHSVLEHLWGQLRTRQALDELDAARRRRVVERSVEHALAEAERGGRRGRFTGRIAELERERLVELALDWLAVEERRDHFEVAGREVEGEIERGGLRFRVRLDRVDRLPDGTEVILDYKTGPVQVSALHGDDRPDDLQLALYARHHAAPVAGVAWAVVRRGECGFTGLAREGDCLPGVRSAGRCLKLDDDADAWRTLHEVWDAALDTLIAEARHGDARVDPKPRACQRCPLPGLCRVGDDASMDDAPA
jgi:probable DNA repair protein